MTKLVLLLFLALFSSHLLSANIYVSVDKNGNPIYSDRSVDQTSQKQIINEQPGLIKWKSSKPNTPSKPYHEQKSKKRGKSKKQQKSEACAILLKKISAQEKRIRYSNGSKKRTENYEKLSDLNWKRLTLCRWYRQ